MEISTQIQNHSKNTNYKKQNNKSEVRYIKNNLSSDVVQFSTSKANNSVNFTGLFGAFKGKSKVALGTVETIVETAETLTNKAVNIIKEAKDKESQIHDVIGSKYKGEDKLASKLASSLEDNRQNFNATTRKELRVLINDARVNLSALMDVTRNIHYQLPVHNSMLTDIYKKMLAQNEPIKDENKLKELLRGYFHKNIAEIEFSKQDKDDMFLAIKRLQKAFSNNANFSEGFVMAVKHGNADYADVLLKAGCDPFFEQSEKCIIHGDPLESSNEKIKQVFSFDNIATQGIKNNNDNVFRKTVAYFAKGLKSDAPEWEKFTLTVKNNTETREAFDKYMSIISAKKTEIIKQEKIQLATKLAKEKKQRQDIIVNKVVEVLKNDESFEKFAEIIKNEDYSLNPSILKGLQNRFMLEEVDKTKPQNTLKFVDAAIDAEKDPAIKQSRIDEFNKFLGDLKTVVSSEKLSDFVYLDIEKSNLTKEQKTKFLQAKLLKKMEPLGISLDNIYDINKIEQFVNEEDLLGQINTPLNEQNETLLHILSDIPITEQNKETYEKVLDKLGSTNEINWNVPDNAKNTPVHKAIMAENIPYVKLLANKKADFFALNGNGENALEIEKRINNPQITEILNTIKHDNPKLIELAELGSSSGISMLIKNPRFNINTRDINGNTAWKIAARKDDISIMEALENHPDLDVMAIDKNGDSAGIEASSNSSLSALKKLAKLNHPDFNPNYINIQASPPRTMLHNAEDEVALEEVLKLPNIDTNLTSEKLPPAAFTFIDSNKLDMFKTLISYPKTKLDISYKGTNLVDYIGQALIKAVADAEGEYSGENYHKLQVLKKIMPILTEEKNKRMVASVSAIVKKNEMLDFDTINSYINYPNFKDIADKPLNAAGEKIGHFLSDVQVNENNMDEVLKTFKILLNNEYNFNQADNFGRTALGKSVVAENEFITELLIKNGADPKSAIELASKSKNPQIRKMFEKYVQNNKTK